LGEYIQPQPSLNTNSDTLQPSIDVQRIRMYLNLWWG